MATRTFGREFKVKAVRLVRERGVSVAQAESDLDLHKNMLRRCAKELATDPSQAFPGQGLETLDRAEVEKLRRQVAKLRAEREILKKAAAYSAREALRTMLAPI